MHTHTHKYMDTRTHRQVEVVFEVLPPLAAAVALAAVVVAAAVVTLGGLVWSPAERERERNSWKLNTNELAVRNAAKIL